MSKLKAFEASLVEMIGDAEGMRPLLCDGNPLTCTVALIAANPATKTPFWEFWKPARGMIRAKWIARYLELHDNKFGRSRGAIERFVPQVSARVIELNAYPHQSTSVGELPTSQRDARILRVILKEVGPKVIICAGRDATDAVNEMSLLPMPTIIDTDHLRSWGRKSEHRLANAVNAALQATVSLPRSYIGYKSLTRAADATAVR